MVDVFLPYICYIFSLLFGTLVSAKYKNDFLKKCLIFFFFKSRLTSVYFGKVAVAFKISFWKSALNSSELLISGEEKKSWVETLNILIP